MQHVGIPQERVCGDGDDDNNHIYTGGTVVGHVGTRSCGFSAIWCI